MRTSAQVMASRFYYCNMFRRKTDQVRSKYGVNNQFFIVWYHRGSPIVIRIQVPFGEFIKLEAPRMTKSIADRFNAIFSSFGKDYVINGPIKRKWFITIRDNQEQCPILWKGQFILQLAQPTPRRHTTIKERLETLYGNNWTSAA